MVGLLECVYGRMGLQWDDLGACLAAWDHRRLSRVYVWLQQAFAGIAQSVSRAAAAGLLLPPPKQPVLSAENACSAVSTLLVFLLAFLVPTLMLFYSEVRCFHHLLILSSTHTPKSCCSLARLCVQHAAFICSVFPTFPPKSQYQESVVKGWRLQSKCRMEFLHQRNRKRLQRTGKPFRTAARVWIEQEASLEVVKLLAGALMLPVTSVVWNLLIDIHRLL